MNSYKITVFCVKDIRKTALSSKWHYQQLLYIYMISIHGETSEGYDQGRMQTIA